MLKSVWVPCILLLGLANSAFGQLDRGTITGVVSDPTGAVVAGAIVTATNVDTNTTTKMVTTSTGNYTLLTLIVGRYNVQVEVAGFKRAVRDGIPISAGSTVRLDVVLEIGSTSDSVEVNAQAGLLETETTRVATTITNKLVDEVPLQVAGQIRNVFNLLTLAPEVKTSGGNYRIAGGQSAGWDMLMDGMSISVTSAVKQAGRAQITSVPIDAISEFTVESTGMKAEYGRASGIVNFATKSGTDQFHGNVFDYLRNDAFDARGFFSSSRPVLRQNDFGATFGGPVLIPKMYNGRNKTFFFFSYEGFRSREASSAAYYSIPLPAMYTGDFSGWVKSNGSLIQLYDPATTTLGPISSAYVRTPFPNNQVPVNRFSTVARNYLALRPAEMVPNLPGTTLNYFLQRGSMTYPWDKGTARMDHRLSSKDTLTFFFMRGQNADAMGPEGVPGLPFPFQTGPPLWDRKETYGKFGWTRMITPQTLSSLRFNKMKSMAFIYSAACSYSQNNWNAKLGIKNTPGPDRCLPPISMTDYTTWAGLADAAWGRDDGWDWSIAEDLSHVHGSHTFKGGFYYSRNDWAGGGQGTPNGQYGFTQLATAIPGDQSKNTGNAFASFLLGYTDNAGLQTPRRQVYYWKHLGGYFQDDWRVNSKLNINMGLRYDYTFPLTGGAFTSVMKDALDTIGTVIPGLEPGYSNFDPNLPNPGAGGLPGSLVFTGTGAGRTGSADAFPSWKWALQPRLGLAYVLRQGTVLRVSGARSFQDIKTPGGTSHFDGFIGTLSFTSSDLDVLDFPMLLDAGLPAWKQPPYLQPDVSNRLSINWWDPKQAGRPAEFWTWNFDIQQQVAHSTVLTVRYSGSKGTHLTSGLLRPNQISPDYLTSLGGTLLRSNITSAAARAAGIKNPYTGFNGTVMEALQPFPQYKTISVGLEHIGDSTYHALVVMADRRLSAGLTMLASYTLSKLFSNADSVTGGTAATDNFNRALDKALSAEDQTHVIRYSLSYDLPAGKGKRYLTTGIASAAFGGWGVSGTGEYASGTPMSVSPGITLPYGGGDRVFVTSYDNWLAPATGASFDPFKDVWFNKNAFNQVSQTVLDTQIGNATRNNPKVRSPWFLNESVSLARNIPVKEHVRVSLRFEAFNLFNRVRWGGPTNTLNSPNFGLVRSQGNDPRKMQAALKLYF